MYFDPATIIISAVLTLILVGVTLAALFRHSQSESKAGYWWVSTFVMTAGGFVCFGVASEPHSALRILMNVAFLMGYACCYNGARGSAGRRAILWPVAVALFFWPIFVLTLTPDLATRSTVFSLLVIAYAGGSGIEFYRGSAAHERSRRLAAILCALHAIFYGFRAVLGPTLMLSVSADSQVTRLWAAIVSLEALPYSAILAILVISISHEEVAHREKTIANTDYLTGIGNRRAFEQAMAGLLQRMKAGVGGHLLLLDLDRFKQVNDGFGHAMGDQLLCEFSSHVKAQLGEPEHFWRLGGDEFAILVAGPSRDTALDVARRVRAALEAAPHVAHLREHIPLGVSIGLAPIAAGGSLSQILSKADAALYQAKAQSAAIY